jgi:hypothetical protein
VSEIDMMIIDTACENIERGGHMYSCNAIELAYTSKPEIPIDACDVLVRRYADFYERGHNDNWFFGDTSSDEPSRGQRILMLLLFAEAEKDVL